MSSVRPIYIYIIFFHQKIFILLVLIMHVYLISAKWPGVYMTSGFSYHAAVVILIK